MMSSIKKTAFQQVTETAHPTPRNSVLFTECYYDRIRGRQLSPPCLPDLNLIHSFIHSFSILSDDRSKASSKTNPVHSAIQSFLLQMRVSSPVLKFIQQLLMSSFSSSCHFHLSLYLSFDNLFQKAVSTQDVSNQFSLLFSYFLQDIPLLIDSK